ncbi:type IV pilus assembly protein PilM [Dactylosporangium sucinum]|uniref:Pilus assembly protein PilM n=1 Tax=Dactylosporangium sucinum TaxID=1424081 RepID=A0A917TXK6_9ACTN|nr:type IV pilus assembly protein PilM [Dactylosporangium sucinum]GGM41661.1 pilus assembly protein PilM [Dactylosporangium sucinum]
MAAVNPIGLDIGTVSIRAAETRSSKDGPIISNFGHVLLPPGVVQNGAVQDERAVTVALRQLWRTFRFRTRKVALGVTHQQVVVRESTVANLPAKEMRQALPFQVRDALPLPPERSLIDFYPLEDPGSAGTVRGLLIAAPKEPVLAAIRAIEAAKLSVVRVDLASFALLRAASRLDEQVEAIIDIGAHATSVVVHHDGEPLIVRTIPRGGNEITKTVADRLDIPLDQAEELKCRLGLRTDADPASVAALKDAVRPLVNEIGNSFAYLTAAGRQARVSRLALSGGGSLLPGLLDALHQQLGVEVLAVDPVMRLRGLRRVRHGSLEHVRASAAVSVGLTLGATA